MNSSCLYIFSGLPGSGKSTLSRALATHLGAMHLRIDVIEQGLRDLCGTDVIYQGYQLAHWIAADNLKLGQSVIADSCNPIELTRRDWEQVAKDLGVEYLNIEITCSDKAEHRQRIESRNVGIPGLKLPDWQAVCAREYDPWPEDHPRLVRVDTAGISEAEAFDGILTAIAGVTKVSSS